ncbi:MAG: hypothetical protein RSF69_02095 [Erysipelotrichaceae bacterium]
MKKQTNVFIFITNVKKKLKHYWAVSNDGFLSIYALTLLSLILFVGMIINQQIYQLWYLKTTSYEQSMIEFFVVKHIKDHWEFHEDYEEEKKYKQVLIHFHYNDETIKIDYLFKGRKIKLKIIYDEICSCIMHISYQ